MKQDMLISMYETSIPHFVLMLDNLSSILDKSSLYAKTKEIDEQVLIDARLAPDMYPLSQQIRIVTNMAKACAARLAGLEIPRYEDNEVTFADYKARIAKTVAFLQSLNADQINGSEARTVTIKMYDKEVMYSGKHYLFNIIIPHFYFHVTTAYAILRHHGVELGKKDYINNELRKSVYKSISIPTGQWSDPVISGRIKASLIFSVNPWLANT